MANSQDERQILVRATPSGTACQLPRGGSLGYAALCDFTAVAVSAIANAKNSILRCAELAFLREEGGPLAVEGASGRFRGK